MSDSEPLSTIEYQENNYRILLGCFFGISSSWGIFFICGTYQDYFSQHQLASFSTFAVSWIFSVYYFFIVAGNILSGLYFDISGFNKLLAIPLCAGLCMLPFVHGYGDIMTCFVLLGLGGGILIPPILGCLTDNFFVKRTFANSCAIAGAIIVGIIYPVILQKGFDKIGYEKTNFIISGLLLAQLGLCLLLCNDRKELRRKLQPHENFWSIYFKESFDYRSLIEDKKFMLVSISITAGEVSTAVLLLYVTSYCSTILNFDDSQSFNMITILNVGTLIGGCSAGIVIADKVGKINCLIAASFSMLFLNLVFWLGISVDYPKIMYAFSLLWGFNYGVFMSLCPSIVSIVSTYYDFGKKYSTIYFIVGLGFLAGIPISGVIIGVSKKANFINFIVYASALLLISLVTLIALKIIHLKEYIKYKNSEIEYENRSPESPSQNSIRKFVHDQDHEVVDVENSESSTRTLKLTLMTIISAKY